MLLPLALAFLLPAIHMINSVCFPATTPSLLVLSPTRELALQTEQQAKTLMRGMYVYSREGLCQWTAVTPVYVSHSTVYCVQYNVMLSISSRAIGGSCERINCLWLGLPNMLTAGIVGGVPLAQQLHRLKSSIQVCHDGCVASNAPNYSYSRSLWAHQLG